MKHKCRLYGVVTRGENAHERDVAAMKALDGQELHVSGRVGGVCGVYGVVGSFAAIRCTGDA